MCNLREKAELTNLRYCHGLLSCLGICLELLIGVKSPQPTANQDVVCLYKMMHCKETKGQRETPILDLCGYFGPGTMFTHQVLCKPAK